jgi:hypothetical protein
MKFCSDSILSIESVMTIVIGILSIENFKKTSFLVSSTRYTTDISLKNFAPPCLSLAIYRCRFATVMISFFLSPPSLALFSFFPFRLGLQR